MRLSAAKESLSVNPISAALRRHVEAPETRETLATTWRLGWQKSARNPAFVSRQGASRSVGTRPALVGGRGPASRVFAVAFIGPPLTNPSNEDKVETMLRTATTGSLLDTSTDPFAGSMLQPSERPIPVSAGLHGEESPNLNALLPGLDAEMSLAISLSVPLAAAGATLVACAATLANEACFALGGVCLFGVFLVQLRVRRRVRQSIQIFAKEQGYSERTAQESAARYLRTWLG
jgi:hypothetical protein